MTYIIERVELILLISAAVAIFARRFHLPYTVGLVFAGTALALSPISFDLPLTKELIYSVLLPPLIFEASFHLNWRELKKDLLPISIFATLGVVISAALVGAGLHAILGWELIPAMLLGTLLSATDPVSVIATFKEMNLKGRLRVFVEAESLFNDGTVVVLFMLTLSGGASLTLGHSAVLILSMVSGGLLCGFLTGGAGLLLMGRTEDHLVEATVSTVVAFGSFLLAEHIGFSGVISTLAAGLSLANLGSSDRISLLGREAISGLWEFVGFVANSTIFLLIGRELAKTNLLNFASASILTIALVLLSRGVATYGCSLLFNWSRWRLPFSNQRVLIWGGLRGAIALALVLELPLEMPERTMLITVCYAVVAFSIIVQGITIPGLLRREGLV